MTPTPTTYAWAIKAQDGRIISDTRWTEAQVAKQAAAINAMGCKSGIYRCVRVQIQEVPHD